ncbi:MAG: hypothetical protein LBS36_05830 [Oscillospiraceae bacterium]|jgi:uncharacterized membrane protein YjdF|nr:hypothetical protein [Oscillospiraceae bacterium]
MKKLNEIRAVPMKHKIVWWVVRGSLLTFGIVGLFTNNVTYFLMGVFSIAFTHLWDMFQLFGGKSFITRVSYSMQTMLSLFIFVGCIVGPLLNDKTDFNHIDVVEHFAAGVVAATFGYDFAVVVQGKKRPLSAALASLFSLCFSMAIAVAWEFYEFTMDRIYGYSLQVSHALTEAGLVDTMFDLILCTAGALVGMFAIAFYRNGIIGKNRKRLRAEIKAQEKINRADELALLALEES